MALLGLGANLTSAEFGSPRRTLEAALAEIEQAGLTVERRSSWYRSRPVPLSDQPWFVNSVAEVGGAGDPAALMTLLHEIEERFGRVRTEVNAARVLDLDLLDCGGRVSAPGEWPVLPHPRIAERAFVLVPLVEIVPGWRHPVTGALAADILAGLRDRGDVLLMDESGLP
jgi:2-amino-4-hydroxy-6-hydroxymethyldihydropteridine diphosphokinase